MNIGDEDLAHVVQGAQEGRFLAIAAIAPTHSKRMPRVRAARTISSARSVLDRNWRACAGISAKSHRAGSSI
jgi:hypothetical protein